MPPLKAVHVLLVAVYVDVGVPEQEEPLLNAWRDGEDDAGQAKLTPFPAAPGTVVEQAPGEMDCENDTQEASE